MFTFFVQLEKEYNCNSLCEVNLFYINKDLDHGIPHKECLKATSDAWGSSATVRNYGEVGAALSITGGILLLFAAACSVQKCQGFGNDRLKKRYTYKDGYV